MSDKHARAKRVLIIAPHFPPSNLAGVHRSRLFAQHLESFGWTPIVLTVDPRFYEEKLDLDLRKLVSPSLRVETVPALPTKPWRIIGDIGLRGFVPLLKRGVSLARSEKIDFVLISIPSFYAALIGPFIKYFTGIPYGIDYIDPWVHPLTGREGIKGRLSLYVARLLEPFAVRRASMITGVAEGYYAGVLERNPKLRDHVVEAAMPYGGEPQDHRRLPELKLEPYLFRRNSKRFRIVFAGALMPRSFEPLEQLCKAISLHYNLFEDCEFVFIGTGSSPLDASSYNVRPTAERFGLWDTVITEYPQRIPYLDTLVHLAAADAVLILGSTEPHYTPSKVYQAVLSGKPILAILHQESSAVSVITQTRAGVVLTFAGENDVESIAERFASVFTEFRAFADGFDPASINLDAFDAYSARNVTRMLANAMNLAIGR
jgi:hypothetical protein